MKRIGVQIGERRIEALRAETSGERRNGMRQFSGPRPLLLSAAPIIHTWGCPPLDLVWIYRGKVSRVFSSKPGRIYFGWGWHCLELPAGEAGGIRKGDSAIVLGES